MDEYEWPEELDLDNKHPGLSPATVSMLSPDTLQQLRRIREFNLRARELGRITAIATQTTRHPQFSPTAFFTLIGVLLAIFIFLAIIICFR
jgi:hypothetical protein